MSRREQFSGPLLQATGVNKLYKSGSEQVHALRNVSVTINQGEFITIMGQSGSGKTTLLNCLSGLDEIDEGAVVVAGSDIQKMGDAERTAHRAKNMGFIFQAYNLIPVFTAAENVELPLLLAGASPSKAREAAVKTLERVGLGHRVRHKPNEMSGGEQQRVAIARALAGRPALVWADEPTGNLDSQSARGVLDLLLNLHQSGMTIVLVTHDPRVGAAAQRRLVVQDGTIVADQRRP